MLNIVLTPPSKKGGELFFTIGMQGGGLRLFDKKGGELPKGQGPVKRGGLRDFRLTRYGLSLNGTRGLYFFMKMSKKT